MMRVTTNNTLYTYKNNLLKSSNQLYTAMNQMMSKRNFDTYAADPAAATRAFKIHSSLNATNAQASNNNMVYNKFSSAWDIADDFLDKLAQDLAETPLIKGLNDPNATVRNTFGDVILSGAESMVQSLNSKYGTDYIFGGADTQNPPFAIETVEDPVNGDKHYLTYRGIRLDDPDPTYYDKVYLDENNQPVPVDPADPNGDKMTNQDMLDKWNAEHLYVDIGKGFEVDKGGNVIDSTAFDAAIRGTDFIGGTGFDADGDPKSIISIMLRTAEIFKGYNEETKTWGPAGDYEDAQRLVNKFRDAQDAVSKQHTALDTKAKYLETNKTQLESTFDALNSERQSIENIDEVEAILTLSWAQTSYNAAIQVGANVIPQSLMDYLN